MGFPKIPRLPIQISDVAGEPLDCRPPAEGRGRDGLEGNSGKMQISQWTVGSLADSAQVTDLLVDEHDPVFRFIVAFDSFTDRRRDKILAFGVV